MGFEGRTPGSPPPRAAPWFDTGPVDRFLVNAVDEGANAFVRNVKARTPVDHGRLIESIRKKILVVHIGARGEKIYESGAETDVEYAPYVEHGTGLWGPRAARYVIRPRRPDGWLRWIDPRTGRPVFAREVHHPGSPGAHMFAQGAAVTEAEFDRIVASELRRFAREVELQNPWATAGRAA